MTPHEIFPVWNLWGNYINDGELMPTVSFYSIIIPACVDSCDMPDAWKKKHCEWESLICSSNIIRVIFALIVTNFKVTPVSFSNHWFLALFYQNYLKSETQKHFLKKFLRFFEVIFFYSIQSEKFAFDRCTHRTFRKRE